MRQTDAQQIRQRIVSRLKHVAGVIGQVNVTDTLELDSQVLGNSWVAIASSRLGQSPVLHRQVCRLISLCMLECRRRQAVLLVAVGSAIEPWALRAAELYGVSVVQIAIGKVGAGDAADQIGIEVVDQTISRDAAVIAIADRVDVVYARGGGNIAGSVRDRLHQLEDVSTRVAITSLPRCAGRELIQAGAIGWFTAAETHSDEQEQSIELPNVNAADQDWMHQESEWLVHCTRACVGPWPGETERQYRDAMLLGGAASQRGPLEALTHILRSGRLIANATASAKSWPVVCFSEVPLAQLLLSRCYRPHLKRWDYEPFGVAIRISAARQLGIVPVVYGDVADRRRLATEDQFRFQAAGKTYDWTAECEWRSCQDVDLHQLDPGDVRVFVATNSDAAKLNKSPAIGCNWEICVVSPSLVKPDQTV